MTDTITPLLVISRAVCFELHAVYFSIFNRWLSVKQ